MTDKPAFFAPDIWKTFKRMLKIIFFVGGGGLALYLLISAGYGLLVWHISKVVVAYGLGGMLLLWLIGLFVEEIKGAVHESVLNALEDDRRRQKQESSSGWTGR